ncbi:MAG: hypothetical protein WC564_00240 [Patescibacteria group bacterium]
MYAQENKTNNQNSANQTVAVDKYICLSRADMEIYCPGLLMDLEKKYGKNLGVNPQVKTADKVVGISREIGIAMNEALTAITKHSEQLAHTNVGMFTLAMVAWKIMGRDFTGLLFGIPILFILFYMFRHYWSKNGVPFLKEKKVADEEGGVKTITYERVAKYEWPQIVFTIVFLLFYFLTVGLA